MCGLAGGLAAGRWNGRIPLWPRRGYLNKTYTPLIQPRLRYTLTRTGRRKKRRPAVGKSRDGWNTKIHAVAPGERVPAGFDLSAANAADATEGRLLLERIGPLEQTALLLTDRAYEDDCTRLAAWTLRFNPVVPPKKNRTKPREYDRELYKQRNETERFFRRLKAFRCVRYLLEPALLTKPKPSRYKDLVKRATRTAGVLNLKFENAAPKSAFPYAAFAELGMEHLPFCVFKRAGREFYYVKFKNETGKYSPAVSTKQATRAAAIATAYDWLKNGRPAAGGAVVPLSVTDFLKQIQTTAEAEFVCSELKRKGLLKGFIVAGSGQDIDFPSFLLDFWDFEKSPYIKEKLRKNHGIHKNYANGQRLIIKRYWVLFFAGRLLGDIARQDAEKFIDSVTDQKFSWARKNSVIKPARFLCGGRSIKKLLIKMLQKALHGFRASPKKGKFSPPNLRRLFSGLSGRTSGRGLQIFYPR
ncbi:MAG: hypothetical protein Pg6C_18230 [Treponemataceae bacterium]|nr:MAG: hypothetical protein Pg6C_18230 [Treponemataceae bacterium]